MKKKISTILFLLLVSLSPVIAMAGGKGELNVDISGETGKGEEIIVTVNAKDINNVGALEVELPYDANKLEYISGTLTKEYTYMAESIENIDNKIKIAMVFENAINEDVTFAEIKFKILADNGDKIKLTPNGILVDIDSYEELNISTIGTEFKVGNDLSIVVWGAIVGIIVIVLIASIMMIRRKKKKN